MPPNVKNDTEHSEDLIENEALADRIQQEWLFKLKRLPEKIVLRCGIVLIVVLFLETMLIVSNNVRYLGYWEGFIHLSTSYREGLTSTNWGRAAHLDSSRLDSWSLWRGWIVPSLLAGGTYIVVGLISLRHELYHWKPELLGDYVKAAKDSKVGEWIPHSWLDFIFHTYSDSHRAYVNKKIQRRSHVALEDSTEFFKVLRVVGINILISTLAVLRLWISLLQTNIEANNIVKLPRSYVPPVQFAVWYFINDFFYYYPHRIAHTSPGNVFTRTVHKYFKDSHRLHHRTKANLGIAAWYCSPSEQALFNLFPALIGPLITQILSINWGPGDIWNTHLVTLYVWLMAASANSVLAHTGYRSQWNDPGKHDLHHERAFNPKTATNFGTMGFFDWIHGTASQIPVEDARKWREQRDRQAALWEASRRTKVPLTREQMEVVKQPDHSPEWVDKSI
jgi:sterol desaturase/sphingolipid hydroxylase (fatty acid hydroxylase superfamily)